MALLSRYLSRPRWILALQVFFGLATVALAIWWIVTGADAIEPITVLCGGAALLLEVLGRRTEDAVAKPMKLPARTSVDEKSSFTALSVTKVVDLRTNHLDTTRPAPPEEPEAPTSGGITVISDVYELRREELATETAIFLYSTSGLINGTSVSHPATATWHRVKGDHLRRSYELSVTLSDLQPGAATRVANRLEYFSAFEGDSRENVETHIDRPTKSLTWILLFAPERPCRTCAGRLRVGRGAWREQKDTGPIMLDGGTLVVWSVSDAEASLPLNDQYGLEWTWDPAP